MPESDAIAIEVPARWAEQEVLVRAWMEPGEPSPAWNGQPAAERSPDRSVPYASEETLCWPGAEWDRPRFCLEREFVVRAAKAGPARLSFAGGTRARGRITVGTMPTVHGRCGQTWATRPKRSLNGDDWRFRLVRSRGEGDELLRAGFRGVGKRITVPSNWEMAGFSKPTYGQWRDESPTIGMYHRAFPLDAPEGTRAHLLFDGATCNTAAWLNGTPVGDHESGFTQFAFDVTEAARKGSNELSLRVSKYSRSAFFENAGQFGYWYLGGVFRPVWVVLTPATWLSGYRFDTALEPGGRKAVITVTVEVTATGPTGGSGHLRVSLEGPDGRRHESGSRGVPVPVAPTGGSAVRLVRTTIEVPAPALWSAETPNLYRLRLELDGDARDAVEERIGLRELRIEGQRFLVNGVPVKLRGVCRHDFSPTDGYATTPALWRKDLELMRRAGVNAVRCSHYPPAEGFIRLCEEEGFYVIHEAAAMWVAENADTWYPEYHVRAEETQRRDLNRACVLAWGLGNEHADTVNFRRAALACRRCDSRPVLYAGSADTLDGDIVTPHYVGERLAAYVEREPRRPVICTEDFTQSRGWWPREVSLTDAFKAYWDRVVLSDDRINGVFLWEWDERAVVYRDGILLSNTKPYELDSYESLVGPWRRADLPWYHLVAEVFAPIRIEAAAGAGTVRVEVTNQHDFTDLGEVTAAWRLSSVDTAVRPRTVLARGTSSFALPPRSRRSFAVEVPGEASDWRVLDVELQSGDETVLTKRLHVAPTADPGPFATVPPSAKPPVGTRGGKREVSAGSGTATFDAGTGQLRGVRARDRTVAIAGPFPSLWITPPGASLGGFPDRRESLDAGPLVVDPAPRAERGEVTCALHLDRAGTPIRIESRAAATREGLLVRYRLAYEGQAVKVPAVGVRFDLPATFASWKWRGRGPWSAFPGLSYAAGPGLYRAPIVGKRKVGPSIPMAEEPLVGQWEGRGGTKSDVDRFWLESPRGTIEVVLGRRAFVECERVAGRVEVRVNAAVAELGDRTVPLAGFEGELLIRWPR